MGKFEFKPPRPGPDYYTFAPRFYNWELTPKVAGHDKQVHLLDAYDPNNLPEGTPAWSREFILKGAELGYRFAPSIDNNWHVDGVAHDRVGIFGMLWGSFLNSLPSGNMGNLIVLPGTHHVLAHLFKTKGKCFHYDGQREKPKPLPDLRREGVADGCFYSLLVEAGDVVLAHPWLAHGVGVNLS